MKAVFANVALSMPHLETLTYEVPHARRGSIVIAPLRKKNLIGLVLSTTSEPSGHKTREGTVIAQAESSYVNFIEEAGKYYCTNLGSIIKAALPAKDIKFSDQAEPHVKTVTLPSLSKAQKQCAADCAANGYKPVLLHGVTGSGKTMIYFHLAQELIEKGQQVLILLPEIALANQIASEFIKAFGYKASLWHSQVKASEKDKLLPAIISGKAKIIIGVRSALLLPYANLGLVVVDEEHDASYKQESFFCYNARDMAVLRGKICGHRVLLGSATPSVESYLNAKSGKYHYLELKERFSQIQLPEVKLLEMQKETRSKKSWICDALKEEIASTLNSGKQVLLFLNRKGYAPLVLCSKCGNRQKCPFCSAWLVFYRQDNLLKCHYCSYRCDMPKTCSNCKSLSEETLETCGPGVERIAEEISKRLPERTVAIVSREETNEKLLSETFKAFQGKKIDVLIGTQILTKGHHFPNLALVGVVDADIGLNGGDIRALERTFQVLHQVSGRSGRENMVGKVYIQTYFAQSHIMQLLKENNFIGFMENEISQRQQSKLPPFQRAVKLLISSKDRLKAKASADALVSRAPQKEGLSMLGPVEARIAQVKLNYRFKVLVLARRDFAVQAYLQELVRSVRLPSNVRLKIDVDPYDFD
jgi:primosomal protein N' (replication factor Y) (superfamily II helicase)